MKSLLIYLSPSKSFNEEHHILIKIQIDNSLRLGWKKNDILLFTNFDYEYNGVKAFQVGSDNYFPPSPLSIKAIIVSYILEHGMIEKDELYWAHDFDAYQMETIVPSELGLETVDAGFTTYGYSNKWSLGSFFFKERAKDIFKLLKETMYKYETDEERALVRLTNDNVENINTRYKKLNITYNLGMRNVAFNYEQADKPLKVIHFHPWNKGGWVLQNFMYGKNEMGIPLMTHELIEIFNHHGIK